MDNYNLNLLEFGGTGDLIATAICDFNLGNELIKEGQVVLNLEGVGVRFHYSAINSNIKSNRNQIYYNEHYLDSFSIDIAPFNLQTQKLFSKITSSTFTITEYESAIAMAGSILLTKMPSDLNTIYIPGISEFTTEIIHEIAVIKSPEFIEQQIYKIYYTRELSGNTLELDNIDMDIPYLKVQILFKGNSDKETTINYFVVEKAALRLTPVFNLVDNAVSYIQLFFKVIDGEQKPKMSVMING